MSIKGLRELYQKHNCLFIFVFFVGSLLILYSILFIFYSENNEYLTHRKGPSLKRRNAFKKDEIDKILNNIKRMKNLKVKSDE